MVWLASAIEKLCGCTSDCLQFAEALSGMEVGRDLIVISSPPEARRDVLTNDPRGNESCPLFGAPRRT